MIREGEGEPLEEDGDDVKGHNPGSEGDQAELSVNKGKNLFSTGEDQHALVFGTEKQAASDPGDLKYMNRLITRPFSEEVSKKLEEETASSDKKIQLGILKTERIDEELRQVLRRMKILTRRR